MAEASFNIGKEVVGDLLGSVQKAVITLSDLVFTGMLVGIERMTYIAIS
jgi:hypothetical protein